MKQTMHARLLTALLMFVAVGANAAAIDDSNWRGGPSDAWFVNWDKALAEAKKTNKCLLVRCTDTLDLAIRSGGFTMTTPEEYIAKPEFEQFAKEHLVPVYLELYNPNGDTLPKDQKKHNLRIVKALDLGKSGIMGGPDNAFLYTPDGKKVCEFGAYPEVKSLLKKIKSGQGTMVEGAHAQTLFAEGYAKLADDIEAERAKLPPATKSDFKVKLTGVAAVTEKQLKNCSAVEFQSPDTPVEIPFGSTALFRVEYDFPKGYRVRMWSRSEWPKIKDHLFFCGFTPQSTKQQPVGYSGKGTAYGHIKAVGSGCMYGPVSNYLKDDGWNCRVKSFNIDIFTTPELDEDPDLLAEFPPSWKIDTFAVNVEFKTKGQTASDADKAGEAAKDSAVKPYVSKNKLHALYRSKDRKHVFVEVCHQHDNDMLATPHFTLDRVKAAITAKADCIALSIAKSKDGVLFAAEPNGIENFTNGNGSIGDYTAAQLKHLKVKNQGQLTNKRLATLEEALKYGKGKILFKVGGLNEYATELDALLNRLDAWESVIVGSSDMHADKKSSPQRLWDNIRSGKLQVEAFGGSFPDWKSVTSECTACAGNGDLQQEGALNIPERVMATFVYGPGDGGRTDDVAGWKKALDEGVTIFRTDRPKELIKYLKQQKRRKAQ